MFGVLGIIISLGMLMYLAYRGINVLVLAPLMALLAVLLSGDASLLLPTYTQVFMRELGGYLLKFFPLFMLGAIFGKLMDDSGSAKTIAHWIVKKVGKERAITAIVLSCGILTYGGVSLFVVAFAVYPIGAALLREINMPKRLIPGAIALGSFTFTMTAFPGTPAIQNAIPIPFFGTNSFAAPGLGLIGGFMMMILGIVWLQSRATKAMANGEGYGDHINEGLNVDSDAQGPSILLALLPIILVIGLNALFTYQIFPNIDAGYLADKKYGATSLKSVAGLW
jgi:H+/gluconate symporter-like permease